jgi:hypothetical protein
MERKISHRLKTVVRFLVSVFITGLLFIDTGNLFYLLFSAITLFSTLFHSRVFKSVYIELFSFGMLLSHIQYHDAPWGLPLLAWHEKLTCFLFIVMAMYVVSLTAYASVLLCDAAHAFKCRLQSR